MEGSAEVNKRAVSRIESTECEMTSGEEEGGGEGERKGKGEED